MRGYIILILIGIAAIVYVVLSGDRWPWEIRRESEDEHHG